MDSETPYTSLAPPVFDGDNYHIWAARMEAHLEANDLWEAVEEDYEVLPLPANPTMAQIKNHKERKTRKSKARATLFAAVSQDIFTRIMTIKSAFEVWNFLKDEYEGDERIKGMQALNLVREFEMQKMKESETIKEYANKLLSIANKVRLLGVEFSDSRIVQKILVTVPEKFEASITSLENTKDLSKITLAELVSAMQAQEQRSKMRDEVSVEGALQAKLQINQAEKYKKKNYKKNFNSQEAAANTSKSNEKRNKEFPPCKHCGKMGHPPFKCWRRPDVRCEKCNKLGHHVRICKSNFQQKNEAQVAGQQEEEQLFVATCVTSSSSTECWLVDSGCTNHMTHNQELFRELDRSKVSKARIGNGVLLAVEGKGTVAIESCKGTKLIHDVLYVPEIDQNLISVGQLLENGFKVNFENKQCVIKDVNDKELFNIKMRNKSFLFDPMEEEQAAYPATENSTEVWHKRLGHFHHAAVLNMQRKELVRGLPHLDSELPSCEACQYGKLTRLPFKQSNWRATEKLQLIHTDLAGPQRTASLKESKYYIIFIDDFSRMCWIYFLQSKSEVAGVFWKFKLWIEKQSGCMIQALRSDNGKEYTSAQFTMFCEEAGIEHQLTTPYTPQQNGVSERKNRTIMEMARCMLHEKGLPKEFWAEAANTAVFLLNRLPTKAVDGKTPFEVWYDYKPLLENFKVFGCLCFTYVPQIKRDKLDKKAEPGIFVGYSSVSKAYRVFQPHTKKILISRDVHFMENEKWSWNNSEKMPVADPLQNQDGLVDHAPVRGTRLLSDIYQRCNVAVFEPSGFWDAKEDPKWRDAMQEELTMIEKNQTWELVERPEHRKVIGLKWVFRTKLNADGSINKHKARLVVKGYAQIFGVDYFDTFAPVARQDTIRMLLAIAAHNKWKIFQLDVKSAFLNGFLDEEIYVEQPEGFFVKGQEDKVYLLKKALYGLKQAPRAWYSRIDEYLLKLGFVKSLSESTLYIKGDQANFIVISLYVDDLLVTGSNVELIQHFKEDMMQVFEMTDLGEMSYFLGMEVEQKNGDIFICQRKYAKEILKKYNMEDCNGMETPMCQKEKLCKDDGTEQVDEALYRSLIGCLMYLTATRPDILYAVNVLSRFMNCAKESHFKAAKRVLRYVKGTLNYGINFSQSQTFKLQGYSDSDWAGSLDDMKSTSGYCFSFGSGIFSWCSKKQEIVAQSTAEAEFIAATAAVNQALWLRKMLIDLLLEQKTTTEVMVDNQAAIAISRNPVFHGKTKHFSIKLFFLRDVQRDGAVCLKYCKTEDQLSDIFTKALPRSRFELLREKLGVVNR